MKAMNARTDVYKSPFNKMDVLTSLFKDYSILAHKRTDILGASFSTMISEVLMDHHILSEYSNVKYSFNLLKAKCINTEPKVLRIMLKHLLQLAFQSAAEQEDPKVSLQAETNKKGSFIQVCFNKTSLSRRAENNFFRMILPMGYQQDKSETALFFIDEAVKKLKGNAVIRATGKGTTITINLPDPDKDYFALG